MAAFRTSGSSGTLLVLPHIINFRISHGKSLPNRPVKTNDKARMAKRAILASLRDIAGLGTCSSATAHGGLGYIDGPRLRLWPPILIIRRKYVAGGTPVTCPYPGMLLGTPWLTGSGLLTRGYTTGTRRRRVPERALPP